MAYRQDDHDRTPLASDSQANNDAAYEEYMRRYRARNPNSNWEPKTRRMVGPIYNPTPWLSPTSPQHPLTPFREWHFDPFVVSYGDRVVPRSPIPHAFPRVEPQRRLHPDESPQLEYVTGEGYRQVEPGTRSGANQQHYSRRANVQRQENERRFLRDVQSEVGRNNGYPQASRGYQVDRSEPRDVRIYPTATARAPILEAREWMDYVQREVNLRGSYVRFPRSSFSGRRF